jgi:hypothetical protein
MADEMKNPTTLCALDESAKTLPPGWRPGTQKYPFRRYQQFLQLWTMQTDLDSSQQGSAIISRLKGLAFQVAMSLSMQRWDWHDHKEITVVSPMFLAYDANYAAHDADIVRDIQPS